MIDDNTKEELKAYLPQYVEQITHKTKGGLYKCPLCKSGTRKHKTGAFSIEPGGILWKCFSCEKSGDIFKLIELVENKPNFTDQVARAAEIAGMRIETAQPMRTAKPALKAEPAAPDPAGRYAEYIAKCHAAINETDYFKLRGFDNETIERFNLGYDSAKKVVVIPYDRSSNYYITRDIYTEPNSGDHDFRKPKTSEAGPEPIFNKGALYEQKPCFVCESPIDAISLMAISNNCNAVALGGTGSDKLITAVTEKRPNCILILNFDNDEAGHNATEKAAEKLTAENIDFIIAEYQDGGALKDANDRLRADAEQLKKDTDANIKRATRDDLTKFFDTIQTEAYKPHPTGIKFFDTLLDGGIVNQSLLLLLAAPAAGKTTLVQQIAEEMARNQNRIIYINFEMSREQMLSKAISAKYYRNGGTKTALEILRGYEWSDDDRAALGMIIDEYRRNNYPYIRYNPDGVTSEINGLLAYLTAIGNKAVEAGEPAPAIVIDYLHLITSNERIDDAELIKQTVVGLKNYAKKYNTFVIGIIASNRTSNKSGRLTMESGRDSSNLEYTGDYILSLNYQEIDSGEIKPSSTKDDITEKLEKLYSQDKRPMILRVLKNRFGRQGKSRKVLFNAPYNIFYDADDKTLPPAGFILDNGAPAFDD